jgi:hypothetical protein
MAWKQTLVQVETRAGYEPYMQESFLRVVRAGAVVYGVGAVLAKSPAERAVMGSRGTDLDKVLGRARSPAVRVSHLYTPGRPRGKSSGVIMALRLTQPSYSVGKDMVVEIGACYPACERRSSHEWVNL